MRAQVGDRLVVSGHRVGEHGRSAEVLEVRGERGAPPFLVRWEDGHESVIVPGSDVTVEGRGRPEAAPPPAPEAETGERHVGDADVRLSALEEAVDSLGLRLESLREDVRALAAAVQTAVGGTDGA